ncbi:unnamed protein product, partial [marine sediment metagenome]
ISILKEVKTNEIVIQMKMDDKNKVKLALLTSLGVVLYNVLYK